MTEKSLFAGFGGAEKSTRTGERVKLNNIYTAIPQAIVTTTNKSTGGRQ